MLIALAVWLSPWQWSSSDWAGLTFLAVTGALLVAWRQVKEAQRLRKEQARPFVVIDFHPWSTIIELLITNTGSTLARNVRFQFTPPLVSTHDDATERGRISDLNLFKNGIPSLAPRKEIRTFFDEFPARLDRGLPMSYDVGVSYEDPSGERYSETTSLDLAMYIGTGESSATTSTTPTKLSSRLPTRSSAGVTGTG